MTKNILKFTLFVFLAALLWAGLFVTFTLTDSENFGKFNLRYVMKMPKFIKAAPQISGNISCSYRFDIEAGSPEKYTIVFLDTANARQIYDEVLKYARKYASEHDISLIYSFGDENITVMGGGKYGKDEIVLRGANERVFLNYYASWGDGTK